MMPRHNLLKPADGSPITLPNKEMAVGIFYMTTIDEMLRKEELQSFANETEAFLAQSLEKVKLREPVNVNLNGKTIETTVGRLMFNEKLPQFFINEPVKASN
jgi:DNA-directed RNA polymerase subunit beta'